MKPKPWGFWCMLFYVWLGLNGFVHAQKSDTLKTIRLATVEIQSLHPRPSAVARTMPIDSLWLKTMPNATLSEVLAQQSPVFVREYGLGGSSGVSIRGGLSNHTTIVWNGINLQSPRSGALDLSLFPSFFSDHISIQYGGEAVSQGSASMAGALVLNNKPKFNLGVLANAKGYAGSFGAFGQYYQLAYGNAKWYVSTKIFQQEAENNFPYTNTLDIRKPVLNQVNNRQKAWGVLQEIAFKPTENQCWQARVWWQKNDRQVPPTMGIQYSNQTQWDDNLRSMVSYTTFKNHWKWETAGAFLWEKLNYSDPQARVDSKNLGHTYQINTSLSKTLSVHTLSAGVQAIVGRAQSNNFPTEMAHQNRAAVTAGYQYASKNQHWLGSAHLRQEWATGFQVPITFALAWKYVKYNHLVVSMGVSRNYRVPSLNDLYWNGLGNPLLQPEQGWMQDLHATYSLNMGKSKMEWEGGLYNQWVEKCIIWLPEGGIWRPKNLQSIWSRGAEVSTKWQRAVGPVHFTVSGGYTLNYATIMASSNAVEIGKQLIYTPLHKGTSGIFIQAWGGTVSYSHAWVGTRFSTQDNASEQDGFGIGQLSLSYELRYHLFCIQLFGQIANLWNETYQVLPAYPMPGRRFQFGAGLSFHKPLKPKTNENL